MAVACVRHALRIFALRPRHVSGEEQPADERAGIADRGKVTEAIRAFDMTDGPALFFPDGP